MNQGYTSLQSESLWVWVLSVFASLVHGVVFIIAAPVRYLYVLLFYCFLFYCFIVLLKNVLWIILYVYMFNVLFVRISLFSIVVIFHVEICMTKPWYSSILSYSVTTLAYT